MNLDPYLGLIVTVLIASFVHAKTADALKKSFARMASMIFMECVMNAQNSSIVQLVRMAQVVNLVKKTTSSTMMEYAITIVLSSSVVGAANVQQRNV